MDSRVLLAVAIIIILIALYFIYKGNFKKIPIQCINLVTGNPKTGKSLLCSDLAPKQYKKVHRGWFVVRAGWETRCPAGGELQAALE